MAENRPSRIKKIVLIQPSFGFPQEDAKPARDQMVFPYGLAHVATALSNAGYEVEVFDIYAHQWTRREVLAKLQDLHCDVIGITAISPQYAYVKWLAAELKKRSDAKIVLGGLLSTYSYHVVLAHTAVDICVLGEGEITAVDLMENLDHPEMVQGLAFKADGQITTTQQRPAIEDLDSLPLPAYHLFPMDVYTQGKLYVDDPSTLVFLNRSLPKTMTVVAGRGCPYRCTFCSRSFSRAKLRSVDRVVEEVKYLIDTYGVRRIAFGDELLILNKKRALELAEKMKPLRIKWDGQGRVNTVDYEALYAMKQAGCVGIGFGIESGSNRILKAMNKGITAEQSEAALKAALRVGLHVKVQLVLGFPGETRETVAETVQLFKKVGHPARRFALLVLLPGSSLYDDAIRDGLIKDEEHYLLQIKDGYGHEGFFTNLTDLTRDEVIRLKREGEAAMFKNYQAYLMTHPLLLARYLAWKAPYWTIAQWEQASRDPGAYLARKVRQVARAVLPKPLRGPARRVYYRLAPVKRPR
ncbi:MAG: radical SAM protein [Chloroflexi bacterium]|nr:radical SAM protein [Chloroflexota bacterium]